MLYFALFLIIISFELNAADGGTQNYIIALQNFTTDYNCASPLAYQIAIAGFKFRGISPSVENPNLGKILTNYTVSPAITGFDGYTELYTNESSLPVPYSYTMSNLDDSLDTFISDTLITTGCLNPSVLYFSVSFSQPEILTQWSVGYPAKYAYNTIYPRQQVLMKTNYNVISAGSYTHEDMPNYTWRDMKIRDVFKPQSLYYEHPTLDDAQSACSQASVLVYSDYLLDFDCLTDSIESNVYLCHHTYTDLEDCKQNNYRHYRVVPVSNIGLQEIFNLMVHHSITFSALLGFSVFLLALRHS